MRDDTMIEVSGLPEGLSFSVRRGEVFGLMGCPPREASQVLQILSGERRPLSGQVRIQGRAGLVRNSIPGFSGRLTVLQNLEFWSVFRDLQGKTCRQRVHEILEQTGLSPLERVQFRDLDPEPRFRLSLARTLLGGPDILLFDGLSGGLDPWSAKSVRSWVRKEWVEKRGGTVVLVSNQAADMTEVCDRVALLKGKRLVWQGAAREFSPDRVNP